MSLDRLGAQLEIKSVEQRLITGFAAAGGIDRVRDVIDMSMAFRKTLSQKRPADVAVFVGHDMSSLPVGIPVEIEATPDGLKTVTRIFDGPVGDNLLAVAKGLQAAGQCLGMSIGYRVTDSRPDRVDGKSVRVLTGVDLIEFSYAARQAIANPRALVTGVKAPGTGGPMYTVEKQGDRFHVMKGGTSLANFGTEADAQARADTLNADGGGKTILPNTLADACFLYVASGGQQDDEGKTVPRSLRHFRYRDDAGALDADALTAALSEIPQAKTIGLSEKDLAGLETRARAFLESASGSEHKTVDVSTPEWRGGSPLSLRGLGYRVLDLSEKLATDHAAMLVLGDDTKAGERMRPEMRVKVRELSQQLADLVDRAEYVDRHEDGAADNAQRRRHLQLAEVGLW